MREILFRGQTRRYGEKVRMGDGQPLPSHWVYGGILPGIGDFSIIYGCENVAETFKGLSKWIVYTDTLGQYTGLKDKNGARIFEGDILSFRTGRAHIVKFEEGSFTLTDTAIPMRYANKFEVIGNIHDNPELLGGERENHV